MAKMKIKVKIPHAAKPPKSNVAKVETQAMKMAKGSKAGRIGNLGEYAHPKKSGGRKSLA